MTWREWIKVEKDEYIYVAFDNEELLNAAKEKNKLERVFEELNLQKNKEILKNVKFYMSAKNPICNISDIVVGIHSTIIDSNAYKLYRDELKEKRFNSILIG